jgi:hypothetical protein
MSYEHQFTPIHHNVDWLAKNGSSASDASSTSTQDVGEGLATVEGG